MVVGAERNGGEVSFFKAVGEFARRGLWIGAAVMVLGLVYLGLGLGQGWVRSAIWNFWQVSSLSQFIKNLIYFVFIFSFAMLRLWVTLLILTYGLKQSYIHGN
jgi:fumarate reductase subunit D